jgi:hypothetical protein
MEFFILTYGPWLGLAIVALTWAIKKGWSFFADKVWPERVKRAEAEREVARKRAEEEIAERRRREDRYAALAETTAAALAQNSAVIAQNNDVITDVRRSVDTLSIQVAHLYASLHIQPPVLDEKTKGE